MQFADAGKAMKNLAQGNPALSEEADVEKQSIIKTKYVTLDTDLKRKSSEPIQKGKFKKICFGICATILLILLIAFFAIWIQWIDEARQNEEWLKKDTDGNRRQLRVYPHRNVVRRRRCTDFEYGCCKIYYDCSISEQEELISNYMSISPYYIVHHDKHGSNCPRLLDLISGYNNNYPDVEGKDCRNSEFGCCDMNYACDIRRRFDYKNSINTTRDLWFNDLNKQQSRMSLTLAKIDAIGSNCPKTRDIVYKYEQGWPTEISGWWLLGGLACVILLGIISANNKK